MKERPILFSAPMVRALLAGTKTQTRRALRDQPCMLPDFNRGHLSIRVRGAVYQAFSPNFPPVRCPYGEPGDRLWVRETWAAPHSEDARPPRAIQCDWMLIHYAATEDRGGLLWRPSIHMPRWASRITLEITGVRVERLQNISEADAEAEGCTKNHNGYYLGGPHAVSGRKQMATAQSAYRDLWESINGPGSWDANPWVWVVEFKREEGTAS